MISICREKVYSPKRKMCLVSVWQPARRWNFTRHPSRETERCLEQKESKGAVEEAKDKDGLNEAAISAVD